MRTHTLSRWLGALVLLVMLLTPASQPARAATTHDIIIYGGGFSAVAAALNAHDSYRALKGVNPRILLINPFSKLGGLGTINGQNFYDIKYWPAYGTHPQGGNHKKFFDQFGQFYSTNEMANWLRTQVNAKGSITVLEPYDLASVTRDTTTGKITSVLVQQLQRVSYGAYPGVYQFNGSAPQVTYTAPVYIDAGENSRFTDLTGIRTSLGRQDNNADRRQQVMTLMFKVKNLTTPSGTGWTVVPTEADGSRGFLGGQHEIDNNAVVKAWNASNPRFQIKAMNVAEDRTKNVSPATGIGEYWVNALLIYNVDSTCERKAACLNVDYTNGEAWSIDYAYEQAYDVLRSAGFQNALKQFSGFSNFQYVYDANGFIAVGETLYIRESVHTPTNPNILINDSNFALTGAEVQGAGSSPTTGNDAPNHARRIGLSFYAMDTNGYTKSCPTPTTCKPDDNLNPFGRNPTYPSYVPIDVLLTSQAPNLLTAAYSASVSSWAWTQVRVLPNLTVLGDAAGISAAHAAYFGTNPYNFPTSTITSIQTQIKNLGGKIDK